MTAPKLPPAVNFAIAEFAAAMDHGDFEHQRNAKAALRAAIRVALDKRGEVSPAAGGSAAHVAPGGESVAWQIVARDGTPAIAYGSLDSAMEHIGPGETMRPLFAHVAPPVSASFDAALAALDVEPTHHPDKMVTTYAILGLDDVRAAHRREVAEQVDAIRKERDEARGDARGNYLNILEVTALARTGTGPVKYADPVLEDAAAAVRVLLQERAAHAEAVRVAVEKEREACAKVCLDLRCRWCRELGEDTNGNHADCCACRDDAAAIRAATAKRRGGEVVSNTTCSDCGYVHEAGNLWPFSVHLMCCPVRHPRPEPKEAIIARLSARVAKLEAALRGTIPFVCTAAIGEFVHPSAKANRDAVMWAIHDLLPGEIRAEGIETPRAALEDKS